MIQKLFNQAHIASGKNPATISMVLGKNRISYQFLYYGGVRTVYKETGFKNGISFETYGTTISEDKIQNVIEILAKL